jgi:hypothetical protein
MDGHNHATESRTRTIGQLLSPADILLDLDVSTKKRVFEEVGRLFEQRHGLPRALVVEGLTTRETLGSTGLGSAPTCVTVGPRSQISRYRHRLAAVTVTARILVVIGE